MLNICVKFITNSFGEQLFVGRKSSRALKSNQEIGTKSHYIPMIALNLEL